MTHANKGFGKGWKERYSPIEYTAIKMLELMVKRESLGPFSVYRLMRLEGGRSQRRDRVLLILRLLMEFGWVEVVGSPPRYRATGAGVEALSWGERFLEFSLQARLGRRPGMPKKPQALSRSKEFSGDDAWPPDG